MKKRRRIPSAMATQHPDNARAAYWEKDGDGFVSTQEELAECMSAFEDLGVGEFMWDWEGKYTDEAVIDKLFTQYHDYFRKERLGEKKFLTFRVPNIWHERSYSLMRALMVILTSEDFANDLGLHSPPLFEVILPMTESAEQLIYIQKAFQKIARFKSELFDHQKTANTDHLEIIPLVESVEGQIEIDKLLRKYRELHERSFGRPVRSLRVFLARSDPAMASGFVPAVLGNKIALSRMAALARAERLEIHPIVGVGSLVFRGGLAPDTCPQFIKEYAGVRTVTVQSAFRYDYPLPMVKRAVKYLAAHAAGIPPRRIPPKEEAALKSVVRKFEKIYRETLGALIADVEPVFAAVPKRRERKLHIGFLAYQRTLGKLHLPRAISFTAGFYSLGVPPEFIGLGRALAKLTLEERRILLRHYVFLKKDIARAGRYLNKKNIEVLSRRNRAWEKIGEDIALTEGILGLKLGPRTANEHLHANLTANALILMKKPEALKSLIIETGILRRSLG